MRILMIIDGLPGGGAEKTVLTLSSGLTELGHQVTLFSLRKVCDYAIPEGIDFQIVQDTCKKPRRKLTEIRVAPVCWIAPSSRQNAAVNLTSCSRICIKPTVSWRTAACWIGIKSGSAYTGCSPSPICAIAAGFLAGLSIIKFVIPMKTATWWRFPALCCTICLKYSRSPAAQSGYP